MINVSKETVLLPGLRFTFPAGWFPKMPLCTSLPPYLFSREHPAGHSQPGLTGLSVSDNPRKGRCTRIILRVSSLAFRICQNPGISPRSPACVIGTERTAVRLVSCRRCRSLFSLRKIKNNNKCLSIVLRGGLSHRLFFLNENSIKEGRHRATSFVLARRHI